MEFRRIFRDAGSEATTTPEGSSKTEGKEAAAPASDPWGLGFTEGREEEEHPENAKAAEPEESIDDLEIPDDRKAMLKEQAEEAAAKAEVEEEPSEPPPLIFGKYKTIAEAEKAYKAAQRKITELSTRPAQAQTGKETESTQGKPADELEELRDQYGEEAVSAIEKFINKRLEPLNAQVQQQQTEAVQRRLLEKHPWAAEHESALQDFTDELVQNISDPDYAAELTLMAYRGRNVEKIAKEMAVRMLKQMSETEKKKLLSGNVTDSTSRHAGRHNQSNTPTNNQIVDAYFGFDQK